MSGPVLVLGGVSAALVCAGIIGLATVALIARLFLLQVSRHDYYADLSQGNRVRTEPIPAARGLILDRHGELILDLLLPDELRNALGPQLQVERSVVFDRRSGDDAVLQVRIVLGRGHWTNRNAFLDL